MEVRVFIHSSLSEIHSLYYEQYHEKAAIIEWQPSLYNKTEMEAINYTLY